MTDYVKRAEEERWSPIFSHYKYKREVWSDMACYSNLKHADPGKVRFLHPFPDIADISYLQWVLDSELFGSFLVSTDAEKGIREGFEAQLHGDRRDYDVLFSAVALRMPFEFDLFDNWRAFRKAGFSELDSFYLMDKVMWDGVWCGVYGISILHLAVQPYVPRWALSLENMNPVCDSISDYRFPEGGMGPSRLEGALDGLTFDKGVEKLNKLLEEEKCVA